MTIENNVDLSLWEPLPEIPNTSDVFRGYAMASVRDIVYISGGNSNTIHRSLLSYDMITRKWTTLPDMIYHRWGHRLAIVEGGRYMFAIGGWGYKSNTAEVAKAKRKPAEMVQLERLSSYEIYDVSKREWKEAGKLREARKDFAISIDSTTGKVYLFGGTGNSGAALSSVEVYDPHSRMWWLLTSMPRPCKRCHAIHVGNLIHIFEAGKRTLTYNTITDTWSTKDDPDDTYIPKCPDKGYVCSSSTSSSSSQGEAIVYGYVVSEMNGQLTNRWMVSHIKKQRSKSWTVFPPADEFMYYRTAIANGKLVVAIGNSMLAFQVVDDAVDDDDVSHAAPGSTLSSSGSTFNESTLGSDGRSDIDEVESTIYDGKWKRQPELSLKPVDYRGYAVVSAGNNVYVSGGFSGDQTVYRSFLSYNVKKKKWKTLPRMTHHRLGHRMVVSDDGCYIYVLGGGDGKTLRSLGIDIYDIKKKTWTSGPAMNSYRVFFGVTVCLGKVLVFGGVGSDNGNELGLVEFYDPGTNIWKYSKPMPEVRGVCSVIAIGHIIYVFGTPSQKVLAYDVILGEWLEFVPSDTIPTIPPMGCVCASSAYANGELLVMKYPLGDKRHQKQRRTAHVYNGPNKTWSSVHLLDDLACYSAVVANDKIVVVTPQNQLMVCSIPKSTS